MDDGRPCEQGYNGNRIAFPIRHLSNKAPKVHELYFETMYAVFKERSPDISVLVALLVKIFPAQVYSFRRARCGHSIKFEGFPAIILKFIHRFDILETQSERKWLNPTNLPGSL